MTPQHVKDYMDLVNGCRSLDLTAEGASADLKQLVEEGLDRLENIINWKEELTKETSEKAMLWTISERDGLEHKKQAADVLTKIRNFGSSLNESDLRFIRRRLREYHANRMIKK